MTRHLAVVFLSLAFALSFAVGGARAAPPPNDDRANAAVIPTFPATIAATTVDATVERLDPQVSRGSTLARSAVGAFDGHAVLELLDERPTSALDASAAALALGFEARPGLGLLSRADPSVRDRPHLIS